MICSIREYRSDFVKTYWVDIEAYRAYRRLAIGRYRGLGRHKRLGISITEGRHSKLGRHSRRLV